MNPLFTGIGANDARYLINFIIIQLHDELNKSDYNYIHNNNDNNNIIDYTNKEEVQKNFMKTFIAKNKSIISDLFFSMNNTITRCASCAIQLYSYESYWFLEFPLEEVREFKYQNNQFNVYNNLNNNENVISIYDCFEYDRKMNLMDGPNQMYCDKCRRSSNASIITNLETVPNILIILLNRESDIDIDVRILFEENLNLSNFIEYKNTGSKYKLIGIITKFGGNEKGEHFIAYCREPKSNLWSKYNDAIVSDVQDFQKEVIDFVKPYILFYKKIK